MTNINIILLETKTKDILQGLLAGQKYTPDACCEGKECTTTDSLEMNSFEYKTTLTPIQNSFAYRAWSMFHLR
jgi:hypothetical protein